jgi:hypothetical protein
VPCEVERIDVVFEEVASSAYPPPVFVAVTADVVVLLENEPVEAYAATGVMTTPAANAATGTTTLRVPVSRRTCEGSLKRDMKTPEDAAISKTAEDCPGIRTPGGPHRNGNCGRIATWP